jgi:diguanylate cyclase (GGDEF)-like protein
MRSLSLKTKTSAAFIVALAALACLGFLSVRETARFVETEAWVSHTREVLETSALLSSHLSDAIAARRGYLLFGDPREASRFETASEVTLADLAQLREISADNSAQQERLRTLVPLIEKRLAILRQSIETRKIVGPLNDRSAQEAMRAAGVDAAQKILELQREFHDSESKLLIQRLRAATSAGRLISEIQISLAIFFCGALIAALAFINHEFSVKERLEDRIRQLALTDPLTGLGNYRRLQEVFEAEANWFRRAGRTCALLELDLNGLKKINDTRGHLAGNRALCRVADAIRSECRAVDVAVRHGGDEFTVVLPGSNAESARSLARRISNRLSNDGEDPPLTFSYGLAAYPDEGKSLDELIAVADGALYEMKQTWPQSAPTQTSSGLAGP